MVLGIDGISLFLIILTTFLFSVCALVAFSVEKKVRLFFTLFLLLELFILASFIVLDFLMFYVFLIKILTFYL